MKISVSQEVKDNAKWRLGDVIADNSYSEMYLIVKDNDGDIVAMALDKQDSSAYMTEDPWYGPSDSIDDLEAHFAFDGAMVHKVNARLDIEKPVIDEKEEKKMMIETGITSEGDWNIGDVIVNDKKHCIALIVKDNEGMYCAMDIDALDKSVTTYSTEEQAVFWCGGTGYFNKLRMMQGLFAVEGWHKAKAVLKVYSNIELGGDKDGKQ